MRKYICTCHAYPFPHRYLGGKCKTNTVLKTIVQHGICGNCPHLGDTCGLLNDISAELLCFQFTTLVKEKK